MTDNKANGREKSTAKWRDLRIAVVLGVVGVSMVGLAYAAVPLYQMFCQVTGFGGTTQRAEKGSDRILDRMIRVRFNSSVSQGLPWSFKPVQNTMDVRIGETNLAFYRAENTGDTPVTGTATFNVTPEITGSYFAKIECFCFTEQVLKPGQSVDMPVSFFIDPGIADDPDAGRVREIVLSYTFFPADQGGQPGEGATPDGDGAT